MGIDLNDKVDLSRQIEITPITQANKTYSLSLDTPETYPVTLFNRKSKEKFNTFNYVTKNENALATKNILDGITYKNILDWQTSSIYNNVYPQMPRAYSVPSISWSLFAPDNGPGKLKKKEIVV